MHFLEGECASAPPWRRLGTTREPHTPFKEKRPHQTFRQRRPRAALGLALLAESLLFLSSCTTIPSSLHVTPPAASLARRVAKLAASSGARMGIVALHVESGRRLELNADDEFEAASVIKVALLTEAAAPARAGRLAPPAPWGAPGGLQAP